MTVRIETREIPAQIVKTTIVTIPGSEWRAMRWKSGIFGTLSVILALVTMLGFLAFMGTVPIILAKDYGIVMKNGTDFFKVMIPFLIIAFSVIYGFRKLFMTVESIEPGLLKKHGWDGESNYEVELDYQTFLHD